ncbi:MAG: hypothetical protein EA392_09865 [Cryomorphaceae bacterium]|nr:MAG: hypothetical protein EA392_09865 [Cryomorphaceae bacterium]
MLQLFHLNIQGQFNCNDILSSENFVSATATAQTEEAARKSAYDLLANQLSSRVSSRTSLSTLEENNQLTQRFFNSTETVSRLRLDGLKYQICERPGRKKDSQTYSVLAYISHDDLKKTAESVKNIVHQYLELAEQKKALKIGGIAEAYAAYLHSFYSPRPISWNSAHDTIHNVQPYLEAMLRNHLNGLGLYCEKVKPHPQFPGEQIQIDLSFAGKTSPGVVYHIDCPAHNATTSLNEMGGTMNLLMQPVSEIEQMRMKITLDPQIIDSHLNEIRSETNFSKDVIIDVDFREVIHLDFIIEEDMETVHLSPEIQNLSIRSIQWSSGARVLSTEPLTTLDKSDLGGEIRMTVNNSESLTVSKMFNNNLHPITRTFTQPKPKPTLEDEMPLPHSGIPADPYGFARLTDFDAVQAKLKKLKQQGKVIFGKETDFVNPNRCWILLIEPKSKILLHALAPNDGGRIDLKSSKRFANFESELKGMIAIWVELY